MERSKLMFSLLIIFIAFHLNTAAPTGSEAKDYGVIVDAGSSGSRVRVYAWDEGSWYPGHAGNLPEINEVHNKKIRPGISSFGEDLTGIDDYMEILIDEAKSVVPEEKQSATRIYVMATAGMRMLVEDDANDVMQAISDLLADESFSPFEYDPLNTRILSGEEEGVFAWIVVNYLRDYFTQNNGINDVGIVEIGGASAQVAFKHDGSILADKFPIKIAGRIYPLYVHSYLGFGQDQVQAKTQRMAVKRESLYDGNRFNPCMLIDDVLSTTVGDDMEVVEFRGSGDAQACLAYMDDIVYKVPDEEWCLPKPCSIGTVYQPTIDTWMPFYALSAFIYTVSELDRMSDGALISDSDNSFSPEGLLESTKHYCSQPLADVEEKLGSHGSEYNSMRCMAGSYLSVLVEKGLGFSRDSQQLHAFDSIDGQSIEWPLGALIYETERHLAACETRNKVKAKAKGYEELRELLMNLTS